VVTLLLIFVGQTILWRSAPVVDALIRHPWLSIVESFALVVGGAFLWLELVESAPFRPTTARPYRIGVSAVAMWTVWVIAYLRPWRPNVVHGFRHVSGRLFSLAIDQQVTTALMWFITAGAFCRSSSRTSTDGCNPRRTPTKSSTISFDVSAREASSAPTRSHADVFSGPRRVDVVTDPQSRRHPPVRPQSAG